MGRNGNETTIGNDGHAVTKGNDQQKIPEHILHVGENLPNTPGTLAYHFITY